MSAAPSEPEKYSIDEMMDRLKTPGQGTPEGGELVTRADGSQAMRVRKRKRRSNQPHKKVEQRSRRNRILQLSAALILVVAAGLVAGLAIIYANSSPFRNGLIAKIEKSSGATVELQQFRVNPQTANAGGMAMTWPEGNVLKSLTLRGLTAEIHPNTFLGNVFAGESVNVTAGTLALGVPAADQPRTELPLAGDPLPIRFNRYRVPDLQVIMGNPNQPFLRLLKTEGSLTPNNASGKPQLSLYQGDFLVAGWPKLKLDRGLIVFNGTEADIVALRLLYESDDRGSLEFSGGISPYQAGEPSQLKAKLDTFDLAGLIGPEFAKLFNGKVDSLPNATSDFLTFHTAPDPSPVLEVGFRVSPTSQIRMGAFPFLATLGSSLDSWFETPIFEGDASGVVRRENHMTTLRNLSLTARDRMALRGRVSMDPNGILSGQIELGLAANMIDSSSNNRLQTLFGTAKDGFRWLTLEISGTAAAPADNFKELFLATSPTAAPAGGSRAETPDDEHQPSSFEELTRPR